jgi:hypothetical protein
MLSATGIVIQPRKRCRTNGGAGSTLFFPIASRTPFGITMCGG